MKSTPVPNGSPTRSLVPGYRSNLYNIFHLEQISVLNSKICYSKILIPLQIDTGSTFYKILFVTFGETYVEQHKRRIGKQLAGYARPFLLATGESSFRVISDN